MRYQDTLRFALLLAIAAPATTTLAAGERLKRMGSSPVMVNQDAGALGAAEFATRGKGKLTRALELGLPDKATINAFKARRAASGKRGEPLQIGFARPVSRQQINLAGLDWQTLADGRQAARFSLTSTGAAALRAELRLQPVDKAGAAPKNVDFRFAGNDGRVFSDTGETFGTADGWSPVVSGDTMEVEITLPAGTSPTAYRLQVPQLSHLAADPAKSSFDRAEYGVGDSDSCERDIVCRVSPTPQFLAAASSVARMAFTKSGGTYYCSGTLLNNDNSPKRQLFWSAAHCISSNTVAKTLQTYWFFDATACDNDTKNANAVVLSGGATLLHANKTRDTLLLELNKAPPAGASYAAWNSASISATGAAIEGIHHPSADLKKYSLGSVTGLRYTLDRKSPLTKVVWNTGVTEGGSSGSGLFTINSNGEYELRGGLYGGTSYCSAPTDPDGYSQISGVWSQIDDYFSP